MRHLRWAAFVVLAATALVAVPGAMAPTASAFKISLGNSLFPFVSPHIGKDGIHEDITHLAILLGGKDEGWFTPGANLIRNIQQGVENSDITHQWDSEQHFDNATIANGGFAAGIALIGTYLKSAQQNARGNEQFEHPFFRSFEAISDDASDAFLALALNPKCLARSACPTAQFLARSVKMMKTDDILAFFPNPDPHQPTSSGSLWASPRGGPCEIPILCPAAPKLARHSRSMVGYVEDQVSWALGKHKGKTLEQTLGKTHYLVLRLQRDRDASRAYRAFQDLGHAFHAAQDFFAHSNYVELMAGVPVGTSIATATSLKPEDVPVPASWDKFTLDGMRELMGDQRFAQLESGAVYTIWLGEGDFCMGDKVTSLFNPAGGFKFYALPFVPIIGGMTIKIPGGWNTNPPSASGLYYCHYQTSGAMGLNKDEPKPDEASHANFEYAKSAAARASELLWHSFLLSILPGAPPVGGIGCTPTGAPADAPPGTLLESCTALPGTAPQLEVTTATTFAASRTYRLVASGTVQDPAYGPAGDAMYFCWGPLLDCGDPTPVWGGWLEVVWNAGEGLVSNNLEGFGHQALPYEPSHVYEVEFTGVSGSLTFRAWVTRVPYPPTPENGSFTVKIYTAAG